MRKSYSWLPLVAMSRASAPSGNDEAVYAEVHETPAEKFSMNENACYEGIKSYSSKSTGLKKENSLAHDKSCKGVFVVLMIALLLLLGTISACIALAVEISKLKSEMSSLQMESASQQSLNALETELEILTQQLNASVISLNQHSLQMESASQQSLNALETKLENLTQQLNASVMLLNQQQSQSHILDEKIELLNSSSQEQFTQLLELSEDTQLLLNAPSSCAALPPFSSSAYYWIQPSIGSPPVQVYCDFNRQCGCGGSLTWTRVAFLNMSDPNEVCPSNWTTYTSPRRACGNGDGTGYSGQCDSVIYPNTMGQTYSRVCGRVIAYQYRNTAAFYTLITQNSNRTIEQQYLDGVSITHGSAGSRQHVWSFASTLSDNYDTQARYQLSACSCSSSNNWPYSTSFIGSDYFCDTGNHASVYDPFPDDPLWDGAGCGPSSTCCTFNNPPWFCKTLPQPTTDDLEVRICDEFAFRDTPIQLMEIYVQ